MRLAASVSSKLILGLFLTALCGTVVLTSWSYSSGRERVLYAVELRGQSVSASLCYSVESWLQDQIRIDPNKLPQQLTNTLESIARLEDIGAIQVMDREGRLIASAESTRTILEVNDPLILDAVKERHIASRLQPDGHTMYFVTPLVGGGQATGKINPEISAIMVLMVDANNRLRNNNRIAYETAFVFLSFNIVVVLLIYLLVNRLVLKPSLALSQQAARLGEGDLTARSGLASASARGDEIERLAYSFDGMAARMQTAQVEREKASTELKNAEARLRNVFESQLIGIFFWELNGQVLDANDFFLRMVGYSREDMKNGALNWRKITPPEHTQTDDQAAIKIQAQGYFPPFEKEYYRKDGTRLSVLVGGTMMAGQQTRGAAFVLDLTERRKLEDELRQSQKMEAIGKLAGGIAHDFNNLLLVIQGYAEMVREECKDNDQIGHQVGLIIKASDRAAELTRQLLAYSRRQILQPRIFSLSKTVADMYTMLHRLIGEDIQIIRVLEATGSVNADPGQLEQVIMNLAINARDAMPKGGKLTLETLDADLNEDYSIRHGEVPAGSYVMLAVSDTGVGMSRDLQSRIFEPYFTTKPVGKGTGLGLSTVYGIVKQSGGHVFVYSEPGRGSTFKVYLPRVRPGVSSDAIPMPAESTPRPTETVLVVEDEDSVRAMLSALLTHTGYTVLVAADGVQALEVVRKHPEPIHLLITDVIMPRMNGKELAKEFITVCPDSKVLYVSGYSENAIVHDGVLDKGVNYLQKPFSHANLLRKIRSALGASTAEMDE